MKKSTILKLMLSFLVMLGSIGHGYASDWTLSKTTGNVEFHYRIGECNGQTAVFIKIINKNDYAVEVSWKELVADNNSRTTIEGFYGEKQLNIPAATTLQANCTETDTAECMTLATSIAPTHKVDIKSFEFKDIQVNSSR